MGGRHEGDADVAIHARSVTGYDPFGRGGSGVKQRSGELVDERRDRHLTYEVWSPDSRGPHPLVLYSHSSYGTRTQSSLLAVHLASHGYVVGAADHAGNTRAEWGAPRPRPLTPEERDASIAKIVSDRVPDLRALADRVLAEEDVDRSRMGLVGWSFGGWAVLATPEQDDRFASIVAHAPGGARQPLPNIIPSQLTFGWRRVIPTLFLAAERDQPIPLDRVRDVFERAPRPKRLFVLEEADHGHFADEVPSTPPSADAAHLFTHSLTLAHLDATLRADAAAADFLAGGALSALRARGANAYEAG